MGLVIRLRRHGSRKKPFFRIVVADSRSPRDGRCVATIGDYNPRTNPARIQVDAAQARTWLERGALPTDTVRSLLRQAGVLGQRPA
jgi:small subunit ribosomal protein S16